MLTLLLALAMTADDPPPSRFASATRDATETILIGQAEIDAMTRSLTALIEMQKLNRTPADQAMVDADEAAIETLRGLIQRRTTIRMRLATGTPDERRDAATAMALVQTDFILLGTELDTRALEAKAISPGMLAQHNALTKAVTAIL